MFSSNSNIASKAPHKFPIIYSERFLEHDTGIYHPEKAGRLTAIVEALKNSPIASQLIWQEPTAIAARKQSGSDILQEVRRFHTQEYIDILQELTKRGGGYIDGDTIATDQTYDVALLAVSAWLDGVDIVLESGSPAFVLARPPGHHARAHSGMGFCIFGNAAIAAMYAKSDRLNLARVAILDWDVHHGNGTQEAVWDRPDIAYVSTHQAPFYPMTGRKEETGAHNNILNIPMRSGSAIAEYLPVFQNQIMPFLRNFNPDLLIVSAGFDANADDPLASILLKPEDFGTFTKLCLELTPKILFGLEGGYDFDSLSRSVISVIEQCLN